MTKNIVGRRIADHVRQALRDYGISDEVIAADPDIGGTSESLAADLIETLSPPDGVGLTEDWSVDATRIAAKIMSQLGIRTEPSLDPGADPRRDGVAAIVDAALAAARPPPDGVGLTRYGWVRDDEADGGRDVVPKKDGEWVRHEDAAAALAAKDAQIALDAETRTKMTLTIHEAWKALGIENYNGSDTRTLPEALTAALAAEQMAYQSVKNALHAAEKREAAYLARGDEWQAVAEKAGVCMACALGAHEPYGCTDCLNTGWAQGAPPGYVDEAALAAEKARGDGLAEALQPFADALDDIDFADDAIKDNWSIWERPEAMDLTVGHLRAAKRAALSVQPEEPKP